MPKRDPSDLFTALTGEFRRYLLKQQSQVEREILVFPANEGDRLGQALFSNLATGGFCTLVVTGRRDWDPRSYYHQAARFAAYRGCKIRRAFLLSHRHCRHDITLEEHLQLDEAVGIKTEVLYVGELLSRLALPIAESLEFGIWDDAIGCIGVFGPSGAAGAITEWRVTARREDLQTLRDIRNLLDKQAQRLSLLDPDGNPPDLEEPMITTAPIAHEMAPILCQGDHVSPEDCSWYHGVWQYLRIFNMVSTPTWHTDFYFTALQSIAVQDKTSRVLISGTADYSMLAHLLWAFRRARSAAEVTVLDLCETPLFLCRWYAKSLGVRVNTVAADIHTFEGGPPFDLIVTDAFLTRFTPEECRAVLDSWATLLRSGGHVVTTIRIEPGLSRGRVHTTPEQADAFRRRALQEARRWQGFIRCAPEQVANLAQRYAERMVSYPLESESAVRAQFEHAGFEVTRLDRAQVPGEMAGTLYAEVVACRS